MNADPKRHHIQPVFLLKNFCDDDGMFFVFDKRDEEQGVFRTKPDSVFVEKHLYSHIKEDGNLEPKLERAYSELEGKVAPLIKRVVDEVRAGTRISLSQDERYLIDLFMYLQWKRPPDFHEEHFRDADLDAVMDETIREYEAAGLELTDAQRAELDSAAYRTAIRKNAGLDALGSVSRVVLNAMGGTAISLLHVRKKNRCFVIGSNLVTKLETSEHKLPGMPEVEIIMPIAHDVAIQRSGRTRSITTFPVDNGQALRSLNVTIAKQSRTIAGRSRDLVKSLINPR